MRLDIILKVKNLICVNHIDNAANYSFICILSKLLIIVCMCVLEANLYTYMYMNEDSCHSTPLQVRDQLQGVCFLLSLMNGLN